jgi:hypothetical protein
MIHIILAAGSLPFFVILYLKLRAQRERGAVFERRLFKAIAHRAQEQQEARH